MIQLQTIDYCNRSCAWCPQKRDIRKSKNLMTDKCYESALEQAQDMKGLKYFKPFVMNEAFCDSRIFEFIAQALNKLPKAIIAMDSNSDFLYKTGNDTRLNRLLENPKFQILLNIYDARIMVLSKSLKLKGNFRWSNKTKQWGNMWNRAGNLSDVPTNPKRKRTECFIENTATINYKGELIHCCCDYKFESILGTVSGGIQNAYDTMLWKEYRLLFNQKRFDEIPLCKSCNRIR